MTIEWNNSLLEPVLITYNRATHLEETLEAFYSAGLSGMRLHVLDNASSDHTASVVKKMQDKWGSLTYHKNRYNIGGNANILRSLELANSTYHWVIGDDDHWEFQIDLLKEIMTVLMSAKADVIRLGWLASDFSRSKVISASELCLRENLFFASVSMISATILRRSLVIKYLPEAYHNIANSYPQLVSIMRGTEQDSIQVYTTSRDLLIHTPSQTPGYFAGDLEWYAGWYGSSKYLTQLQLKKRFVNEASLYMCRAKPGSLRQFAYLTKVMLYFKSFGLKQTSYLFSMFAYGQGWRIRIGMLILLNALTPVTVLSFLRKLYFKIYRLPAKTVQVDRARL